MSMIQLVEIAEKYYRAMVAGDEAELRRLFEPRATIAGHYEGDFLWQDLDSFIAEAKSLIGQHGDEACMVESVRVDGDIATVAVRGRYAGLWFLDHLAVVEVGQRWTITGKTFRVVS